MIQLDRPATKFPLFKAAILIGSMLSSVAPLYAACTPAGSVVVCDTLPPNPEGAGVIGTNIHVLTGAVVRLLDPFAGIIVRTDTAILTGGGTLTSDAGSTIFDTAIGGNALLDQGGSSSYVSGTITATHNDSRAVFLGAGSYLEVLSGGLLSTTGNGSFLPLQNNSAVIGANGSSRIVISGTVSSSGSNAPAIRTSATAAQSLNPADITVNAGGSVSTTGADSVAILLGDGSQLTVGGTVTASGATSDAVRVLSTAQTPMNISVLAGGTISSSDGVAINASNAGPLNLTLGGTVSGSAAGNVAVQLGSIGPNTVTQTSGSNIVGAIVGGSNVDSAILAGAGVQVAAHYDNFEDLHAVSGYWITTNASMSAGTFNTVSIDSGATIEIENPNGQATLSTPAIANNGTLFLRLSPAGGVDRTMANTTISGTGGVYLGGDATVALNAANTYSGGTQVASGAALLDSTTAFGTGAFTLDPGAGLQAGVDNLVLINDIYAAQFAFVDTQDFHLDLNGAISGVYLDKRGAGTLALNGNNSFESIEIIDGTLEISNASGAGSTNLLFHRATTLRATADNITIDHGPSGGIFGDTGAIIDTNGFNLTINSTIDFGRNYNKVGFGRLVLGGNNSFDGLIVSGGDVQALQNTSLGSGTVQFAADTGLVGGYADLVIANDLQGNGSFIELKSGKLTLTGQISGISDIYDTGAPGNALVLAGANPLLQAVRDNGATIEVQNNDSLGGVGSQLLFRGAQGGGTLRAGADNLVISTAIDGFVFGGTIDTQAFSTTITGAVTGSLTKTGTGTLALAAPTGANVNFDVLAGTLLVNGNVDGGVIYVENGATLGGTGTYTGGVEVLDGGTLAPGQSPGTITLGALTLNSGSVLNFQLGEANVTGGPNNDLIIVTGNLNLDGSLIVADSGSGPGFGAGVYNLIQYGGLLSGPGLAAITLPSGFSGTVQTSIASEVNLIVAQAGVLTQYWDGANTIGNGVIDGGTGTWSVAGTNWTTATPSTVNSAWQGGIAVFAGTAGTATLDAPAAFTGLQFATTGYTVAATGTGGLTNASGAFVYANTGIAATIDAVISGAGALDKQGVGTVTLNAANTYTGGTTITDGTLGVGNNAALSTGTLTMSNSAILQAATSGLVIANDIIISPATGARVDSGSGTFTLNGNISGATGSLSQIGTGNLVLGGNNSFGADLGINQGRVTLMTNTAAGASGIALNNGAVLAAGVSGLVIANNVQTTGGGAIDSGAGTFTINGDIGNLGSISQIGTGNLVLNGNNNFTSGLGINQGTVTLGTNNSAGASFIALNGPGTLAAGVSGLVVSNHIETTGAGKVDSGAGSFTLSGTIGNLGGINKVGSGTLWLTNTSSYTGGTTVSAGTLNLTGALTNSTVTAAGGTFAGTGSAAGLVVGNGGRVSPGTSAGAVATLASTGGISFLAGSTYVADVSLLSADKLTSVGATSITGGTVAAQGQNVQYAFNSTYTILTATGGRTGTFSSITSTGFNGAFAPTLSYDANNVYIKMTPQKISNLTSGLTPNQSAVANAFDAATAAGWNPQSFYALYQQGANLPTALNQLSGEIHSVERRAAIGDQRYVREAALDRLGAGLCSLNGETKNATDAKGTTETCNEQYSLWGRYVGSWGTNQADGNGSYFKTSVSGIIVGIDAKFNEWKVGALFSRTTDHVTLDNDLGSSSVQTTGGGVYVGYRMDDGFAFSAGGTYAGTDFRAGRTITAPGLGQTLQTDASGNVGQLFGEIAYDLAAGANARVEPFARLGWVSLSSDAYSEAGGYAALVGEKGTYDTTFTTLGVRGVYNLSGSVEGASLRGSAGWMHTSGDRSPEAIVAITGTNSPASIYGVAFDEDAAALEAGIDYSFGAFRVGVGYVGVLGKNTKDNGVTATLSWGF